MTTIIKKINLNEFYTPEKCFITEILNTTKHRECSIARARVEPGVTTEWHWLQETDEMYYILSGKGQFEMDGDFIGAVVKDDLVFIPRNAYQRIKNITDQDLIFLCICTPRFEPAHYHTDKLKTLSVNNDNYSLPNH